MVSPESHRDDELLTFITQIFPNPSRAGYRCISAGPRNVPDFLARLRKSTEPNALRKFRQRVARQRKGTVLIRKRTTDTGFLVSLDISDADH
jgi:hypothetical protein